MKKVILSNARDFLNDLSSNEWLELLGYNFDFFFHSNKCSYMCKKKKDRATLRNDNKEEKKDKAEIVFSI